MKKLLVILLISSILLTQCYTQREYLFRQYQLNEGGEIKKVVLADRSIIELNDNQYNYMIKSDTLIIMQRISEKNNDHSMMRTISDTLKAEEIHSVFISELEMGSTVTLGLLVVAGLILLLMAEGVFGEFGFDGFEN